jgi:hypothetical protein
VERFSLERFRSLRGADIRERYAEFRRLAHFDDLEDDLFGAVES